MATQTQIKAKVRECIALAKVKYGFAIKYSELDITFKSTGQSAACAWWRQRFGARTYGLKFSTESASLDSDEMLNDTVPHEVAHLVCMWNKSLGKNHDNGWVHVCIGLGGTGERTHSQVLTKGRYRAQYIYKTDSGAETKCGAKIHKKIQLYGATYTYKPTRESFGKSHYHRTVSSEEHRREHQKEVAAYRAAAGSPAAPTSHKRPTPKQASHKRPTRSSGGQTKKVRAQAIYDRCPSTGRDGIIAKFMSELDMTKAGANTYWYNITK